MTGARGAWPVRRASVPVQTPSLPSPAPPSQNCDLAMTRPNRTALLALCLLAAAAGAAAAGTCTAGELMQALPCLTRREGRASWNWQLRGRPACPLGRSGAGPAVFDGQETPLTCLPPSPCLPAAVDFKLDLVDATGHTSDPIAKCLSSFNVHIDGTCGVSPAPALARPEMHWLRHWGPAPVPHPSLHRPPTQRATCLPCPRPCRSPSSPWLPPTTMCPPCGAQTPSAC